MTDTAVQSWLQRKVSQRADVARALVVLSAEPGAAPAAVWPAGTVEPGPLLGAARRALAAGDRHARRIDDGDARIVVKPIVSDGRVVGTVAMALQDPDDLRTLPRPDAATQRGGHPGPDSATLNPRTRPRPTVAVADGRTAALGAQEAAVGARGAPGRGEAPAGASAAERAVDVHGAPGGRGSPAGASPAERQRPAPIGASRTAPVAQQVLQLVALSLDESRLRPSAIALANELARVLGADRVSVALTDGRQARILAVSHSSGAVAEQALVGAIEAAMDETIDQGCSVCYPELDDNEPVITLAHAELAARFGSRALVSVPLVHGERAVGAITLERSSAQGFEPAQVKVLEQAAPVLGAVLAMRRDAERSLFARAYRTVVQAGHTLGNPVRQPIAWLAIGVTLVLLALPLLPIEYRVTAPARIEGAVQRAIAAPVDGFLRDTMVRPGDRVAAGQPLAALADEDLRAEQRRWQSEVARYEAAISEAMALRDRAQLAIHRARAGEARAQLDLVEQKLARSRIVAPFEGIVISGDLRQRLGAPVQRGEVLLTLAPANDFRVIVEVDEHDIGGVRNGHRGVLTLSANPDRAWPLRIARLVPVATSRDGRNFFEVEARLEQPSSELRPGLEGVAKIEVGSRSMYWILGHRVIDRLRLWLWALLP